MVATAAALVLALPLAVVVVVVDGVGVGWLEESGAWVATADTSSAANLFRGGMLTPYKPPC